MREGECRHLLAKNLKQLCAFGLPVLPLAAAKPTELAYSPENLNRLPGNIFSFAPVIPAHAVTVAAWQQAVHAADEVWFSARAFLNDSLLLAPNLS